MAKEIKSVTIQIEVTKDGNKIDVTETAHIEVGISEYPEFSRKKGVSIELTAEQKQVIINHVKNVVLPQAEVNK